MKIEIKRREIPALLKQMQSLAGIKNVKKALSFGRDIRLMKELVNEIEDFSFTKPARLTELQREFDNLFRQNSAKSSEAEILKSWDYGQEFMALLEDYRISERQFLRETVEMTFSTIFDEADFESVPNAQVAYMLSFFMKN
jgi:hypothetical protein